MSRRGSDAPPACVPVLLVDDNEQQLQALAALLDGVAGLELITATSGEQALRQLLRREVGLVLMAAQMPGMDGCEAATLMRANPKTREVPIVLLSAPPGDSEAALRAYQSGAADYLVQPVDAAVLHAKLKVYAALYRQRLALAGFERHASPAGPAPAAREPSPQDQPLRLLLVDDQPANLLALEGLLGELAVQLNLQLVRANSGPEALRAVRCAEYAAVLLDVQMPGMDGFQTAERLRADPRTSTLPVIFVTAGMTDRAAQFKGYELGAVDYLIKPLEPHILLSKVRVFCELYRQRLALEQHSVQLEAQVAERTAALRRSAAELSDSRERYRRLLGAVTHQMFSLRRDGAQLRSYGHGLGCAAVTGYPPQAFENDAQLWLTIVAEPERALVAARAAAALDSGAISQYEHRIRCCDGTLRWVRSTFVRAGTEAAPVCDVLIEDIDQRRRAEEERAHLVDQLALATRAARLGIWDWNLASNELLWDERMYHLCGVAPGELGDAHQTWLRTTHPDDRALCERARQQALSSDQPFDIEFRVLHPDGSIRYMKSDGQVLRNAEGQAVRMTGTHYDITERKQAEEEMRRHRDHLLELVDERTASLRAIVDNAADGIVSVDDNGMILSFNRAAEQMFGYPEADILGRPISKLIPLAGRAGGGVRPVLRSMDLEGQRCDGSAFPMQVAISSVEVAGRPRIIGILRDISLQKAAEASLIAARNTAEAASQVKSEFLAKMSHELRTPLNAVIGFSQLMSRSGTLLPEQQRNLDIIHRSGQHLLTLINDVLALSKIEAGGTHVDAVDVDLVQLLQEIAEMLRIRAQSAGLVLELTIAQLPPAVTVDAVKLRQVLINLVGNALKFTRQGRVQMQASAELLQGTEAGLARISFVISDTGVGMAAGDLQRIFDPFVQVGGAVSDSGTGLGLAISRQYVELLGGVLQVESEVGRGSLFRFALTLPLAAAPRALPAAVGEVQGLALHERGKRVLVVDDDREAQLLLGELLEPLGFVLAFASNGVQALARVASFAPHLVLMDWRMPELDGLATIRRIRSQPEGSQIGIIMCTASAFEEQCEVALQAGADAFLRKPLDTAQLYSHIERLLGLSFQRAASSSQRDGGGLEPVRKDELAGLPDAVRRALKEGAVELDQQRLAKALAAIDSDNPGLAQRLRHMAQAFRYRELFALLSDS